MTALLKIYDDVTSNKYASLGISIASTAFIIRERLAWSSWINPTAFIIGACAGVAFASLAKTYLADKTKGERNSINATLSYINAFKPLENNLLVSLGFSYIIEKPLRMCGYHPSSGSFWKGFEFAFSITNLALQVLESKSPSIKFQWPVSF